MIDILLVVRKSALDRGDPNPINVFVEGEQKIQLNAFRQLDATFLLGTKLGATSPDLSLAEVMRHLQGVVIGWAQQQKIIIVTDRFASLPVYYYHDSEIFSAFLYFDRFLNEIQPTLTLDKTGFWEMLLLDGGLDGRTLFQEIVQIAPAIQLDFDLHNWAIKSHSYFDFTFGRTRVNHPRHTVRDVHELVYESVQHTNTCDTILLPLSGGLDSRLLAAVLSQFAKPERTHAVTFAHDERSYEFVYARRVTKQLGFRDPHFHRLTPEAYLRALPAFAEQDGARLSIAHCHLYDYLTTLALSANDLQLISGFFSDAIMGYSAYPPHAAEESAYASSIFQRLRNWDKTLGIGDSLERAGADLESIYTRWRGRSSLPTFAEYVYLTQRQQTVLFPLASLYSRLLPVAMPFLYPPLVDYALGLPYEWRYQKRILRAILSTCCNGTLGGLPDVSSSFGKSQPHPTIDVLDGFPQSHQETFSQIGNWWKFRCCNYISVAIQILSQDRLQFWNPYLTETQGRFLRTNHRQKLVQSGQELVNLGILTDRQSHRLTSKHYKSNWFTPQYRLISLAHALTYLNKNGRLDIPDGGVVGS